MKKTVFYGLVFGMSFGLTLPQAYAADTTKDQATVNTTQNKTHHSGEKLMEENKTKADVVTLPSGLQYKILEKGTGKKPGKNDTVTVDYEGTLVDGKVFDSSYQRGQPATFPVSGVILGWQEALQLMNEGDTWMLYIPPNLAYGKTGAGGLIGPDATLIFKVHLIKVQS